MNARTIANLLITVFAVGGLVGCGGYKDGAYSKDKKSAKKDGKMAFGPRQVYTEQRAWKKQAQRERYQQLVENRFLDANREPLSTFSVNVDTASYANVRRLLRDGIWPTSDAVRIEEMINYFRYDYPQPRGDDPFSVSVDSATCPWNDKHQVVRIGLRAKSLETDRRPDCNLVFLVNVSGSMSDPEKLPLVQSGLRLLVEQLTSRDRVAIVVYASATGLVLPSTPGDQRNDILRALDGLRASGSTNGGGGIQLAYRVAEQNRIKDGINRVILCTDGDFNVGTTSDSELTSLAKAKARSGVTLSVMGFGRGNLNDSMMEQITNSANGNYNYIDTLSEAHKVLVEQASSTLVTIAKDVKIQVDFNPAYVKQYRLIGYANRMLRSEDFKDDKKDAGDVGAGHQVTALYEIIPPGQPGHPPQVDPSEYQESATPSPGKRNGEMLTVRVRWKKPQGNQSRESRFKLDQAPATEFSSAGKDFQFSVAVAALGLLLRDSEFKGNANFDFIVQTAQDSRDKDPFGYREEFVSLARRAQRMKARLSVR